MKPRLALFVAAALPALLLGGPPALADITACQSGFVMKNLQAQLEQYNICVKNAPYGPALAMAYALRGHTYRRLGEIDKARADFDSAIEQSPRSAAYYIDRGSFYSSITECAKAEEDFDKALSLGSVSLRGIAYNRKAWLLATCPDPAFRNGRQAIELARQALKDDGDAMNHDTLAAAYGEAGQFQDAIKEETTALAKAGKKYSPEVVARYRARLELYQRGAPLSQAPDLATQDAADVVEG
jgi:tetratricopeptide (TPR) repeat protein